jgi:hypothetical protein
MLYKKFPKKERRIILSRSLFTIRGNGFSALRTSGNNSTEARAKRRVEARKRGKLSEMTFPATTVLPTRIIAPAICAEGRKALFFNRSISSHWEALFRSTSICSIPHPWRAFSKHVRRPGVYNTMQRVVWCRASSNDL